MGPCVDVRVAVQATLAWEGEGGHPFYLAREPWYFGALFLFFALFHATPHALAKWGVNPATQNFG